MRVFIQRIHPGTTTAIYQNFNKKKKRNNPFKKNIKKAEQNFNSFAPLFSAKINLFGKGFGFFHRATNRVRQNLF